MICNCGSDLESETISDARGIYIGRMCRECRAQCLAGFRPEILNDPGYKVEEPIEREDY